MPDGALVASEAEAAEAAARIGGTVVMKGVAADIHHKTEAGLVVLGIDAADPDAVAATYRLLEERAAGALEAVLIEQMIKSNRELMVGMKRDAAFGPVVAFGLGGVLTEALGDVALGVAPLDDREARELPGFIRAKRLLGSFRGYPAVDRTALAKVIQAIGQMALDHPEIAEIDVNPLMVEGDRPVAADALIILSAKPAAEPARSLLRAEHQGAGGSPVDGCGGRLGRHHQMGRVGASLHHRRRLHREDLPGESQRAAISSDSRATRASRSFPRLPTSLCWPWVAIR